MSSISLTLFVELCMGSEFFKNYWYIGKWTNRPHFFERSEYRLMDQLMRKAIGLSHIGFKLKQSTIRYLNKKLLFVQLWVYKEGKEEMLNMKDR